VRGREGQIPHSITHTLRANVLLELLRSCVSVKTVRLLIQAGLVQTARANEIEPYAYPRRLFAELPAARSLAAFKALLPFSATN
jgi:hypothetical protein